MLYQLGIGYHTEKARQVAEAVMSSIQRTAHEMSQELAESKGTFSCNLGLCSLTMRTGVFPNYDKSVFAAQGIKMRNAALTNIAPTGTISMMYDVSGGVEPYFALAYYYKGTL